MPKLKKIVPPKESRQPLSKPITVIRRSIGINSIVAKHCHSWG